MSNGHLLLILAIVIVSIMVNKSGSAHEPGTQGDLVACSASTTDVVCRLDQKILNPNEE